MIELVIHYLANRNHVPIIAALQKNNSSEWRNPVFYSEVIFLSRNMDLNNKSHESVADQRWLKYCLLLKTHISVCLSARSLTHLFCLSHACLLISTDGNSSVLPVMFLFGVLFGHRSTGKYCFIGEETETQRRKESYSHTELAGWKHSRNNNWLLLAPNQILPALFKA